MWLSRVNIPVAVKLFGDKKSERYNLRYMAEHA